MFSLEIKSKHNHCRCSKLCPVFVDYEKFLTTWLSLLVLFVIAIMSIPLVKDPNFRRKTSCYFHKVKCYVICMADKVMTFVGQSWRSREENRAKAKQAIASKKEQAKTRANSRKKLEAKAKEDKKKMDKKYGKPASSKSRSGSPSNPDRSPSTSRERRSTTDPRQSKKSISDLPGPPSKRKSSQMSDQNKAAS